MTQSRSSYRWGCAVNPLTIIATVDGEPVRAEIVDAPPDAPVQEPEMTLRELVAWAVAEHQGEWG